MTSVAAPVAPDLPPVDPHTQRYEETNNAILDLAGTSPHGLDDPLITSWIEENEAEYKGAKDKLKGIVGTVGIEVEQVPSESKITVTQEARSAPRHTGPKDGRRFGTFADLPEAAPGVTWTKEELPTATAQGAERVTPFQARGNRVSLTTGAIAHRHGPSRHR